MPRWICTTPCVWGTSKNTRKSWEFGEEVTFHEKPNHHFEKVEEFPEEIINLPPMTGIQKHEMTSLTKAEINIRYDLNHDDKKLHFIKKADLIKEALEKVNGDE